MLWLFAVPFGLIALLLIVLHIAFRPTKRVETKTPKDWNVEYQSVIVQGVRNKQLHTWVMHQSTDKPLVILLHGWGANMELLFPLALPFLRDGLNVIMLDARCHGHSDSDTFASMPRFAEDIESVITWLDSQSALYNGEIFLVGHSLGAAASLLLASRRHDISAVISISAFGHPAWIMQAYFKRWALFPKFLQLIFYYVEWVIGHRLDDIAPINTIKTIQCPVMIVHGKIDSVVAVSDAEAIWKNVVGDDHQLLLIDDADHESVEKIETHGQEMLAFLSKV